MVTVLRSGAMRLVIWSNDYPPPHVHVFLGDAEAKIALGEGAAHPRLVENWRMARRDVAIALKLVLDNRPRLLGQWSALHG